MAEIQLKQVSKSFGPTKVIEDLDLTIEDGKFTVLVGASGCGKTTLLRMIAGIGPATSGQILLDGQDITYQPPSKRGVAMVFQNYAIYPTMTVRENIEFGLKNNKVPKADRDRLIAEFVEIVGLTDYLERKPSTLSGGQRQRVALARAMVKEPKVFLMDEPLSNLDAKLRVAMRSELIELHHRLNTTFVYVTHDQVEAMSMADTIVLMDGGKIMQMSSPEEIYGDPDNMFTAKFIGTPPMNSIENNGISFGFRPEHAKITDTPTDMFFCEKGAIVTREMLGAETIYQVRCASGRSYMVRLNESTYQVGPEVYVSVPIERAYFFGADGVRIREGDSGYADCIVAVEAIKHA